MSDPTVGDYIASLQGPWRAALDLFRGDWRAGIYRGADGEAKSEHLDVASGPEQESSPGVHAATSRRMALILPRTKPLAPEVLCLEESASVQRQGLPQR